MLLFEVLFCIFFVHSVEGLNEKILCFMNFHIGKSSDPVAFTNINSESTINQRNRKMWPSKFFNTVQWCIQES